MSERKGGWLAALRRILGRREPPKPAPRTSRSAQAPMTEPWQPPEAPKVRYMKERASQRFKADPLDARRRRRLWLGVAAGFVLLIAAAAVAVAIIYDTSVPEALQGTWRTDEERYANRRLELLADQVVFQVGDSSFAVERYPVKRVRSRRSANGRLFRITYAGPDGDDIELQLFFEENGRIIRFANQMEFAWNRTGPPGPRPRGGFLLP